jgi:hypothetical protein
MPAISAVARTVDSSGTDNSEKTDDDVALIDDRYET